MKRKYIYIFMQLFTSLCLVSVGFASWTFVSGDTITAEGNIVAQDVNNFEEFIYFDGDIEGFKYCSSGFLTNDFKKSNVGTTTVNLMVMLDNCKKQYSGSDSLKIDLEFKYKEENNTYNIFDVATITHTITLNENVVVENATYTQDGSYKISFVLEDYLADYDPLSQYIEKEPLCIQIHFGLTDTKFKEAYDNEYLNNIDLECNILLEGC